MRPDALELAHRLQAVTLSLESVFAEDDFAQADALMKERSRLVASLAKVKITPEVRVILENAQRHERELMAQLATFKAGIAAELGDLKKANKAAAAYRRLA